MENVTVYSFIEQDRPVLRADLRGGDKYSDVSITIFVYELPGGIYIQGDFKNMPINSDFEFHVHEGEICENKGEKILILPDLMSDGSGCASAQVYLDRVTPAQIAGRPIVVHLKTESGDVTVACGLLQRVL